MSGFSKMILVIRREFAERVKTKAFIISTILVPVLLGGMMFAPIFIRQIMPDKPKKIAVLDQTKSLFDALDQEFTTEPDEDFLGGRSGDDGGEQVRKYQLESVSLDGRSMEELLDDMAARVEDKSLTAYLIIPDGIGDTEEESKYYARNLTDFETLRRVRRGLSEVVISRRLESRGVDPAEAKELTRYVDIGTVKIGAGGERSERGARSEFFVTLIS